MKTLAEQTGLSRRNLLKAGAAGAGLVVGVSLLRAGDAAAVAGAHTGQFVPDGYLRIAADDSVTMIMPAVEMGQGVYTAIPMILAEELDIGLDRVALEHAPPDQALYGNPLFKLQMTGGSTTVRAWWTPMRKAGAAARAMLVQAAASSWGVDPSACRTEAGVVFHDASGRSLRYGALVARASGLKPPNDPPLKNPGDFRLVGKPHHRLDTPDKVNGVAKYGIDAMMPGLKFATLAASPVFGGKVGHVDDSQARVVPGVRQIVVLDDLVAVVGDHMWAAKQGLDALGIDWIDGAGAAITQDAIWASLEKAADDQGVIASHTGDVAAKLKEGTVVEASYELPFLAHAAMEPMNCTVHVKPGTSCEVWVGTQVMGMAQAIAAKEAGLKPEQVTVNNHLIGGGFGRRLEVDGVGKAVRIANHVDGPVKVVWTREEDVQQDVFRPVYHNRMAARLEGGKVTAWRQRVAGPSIMARYLPPAFVGGIDGDAIEGAASDTYAFDNVQVEYLRHEPPVVPTGFWRGVGPNSSVFATECFMDRLAHETRTDPADFRRALLGKNPRARATLDVALDKAGWTKPFDRNIRGGRAGRGICLQTSFGSHLACVAEVVVADDGQVTISRVVFAVDCGVAVNPDGIISQIQGGAIFGMSAALHGRIDVESGRVVQSNFHDYRVMRINEVPKIEVHLIPSGEAPGGIGEPGTVVVQPAVANAVYAATGRQPARMPLDAKLFAKG